MAIIQKTKLAAAQFKELLIVLKTRFEKNASRHKGLDWNKISVRLESAYKGNATESKKIWSLHEMQKTGGEPDIIGIDKKTGEYLFYDCAIESPAGRRSLCYDKAALDSRKEFKPTNNVVDMAASMGIELLTEEEYRNLQTLGKFDSKTSSWIATPSEIRKLGGALFADFRYGNVFVYHNGAASYYAARGFRGSIKI